MKYFFNILFFPFVYSFSTWSPVNNNNIQVIWSASKAKVISPILDLTCSLHWKNTSHILCYNIQIQEIKSIFPNPFLTLAIKKAQEKNISIDVVEYNATYVKLLWFLEDYVGDFVELRKN